MKKQTYKKTHEAIKLLSEILISYEYGEAHAERMEVLKAFNSLSDLVSKPKGFDSAKRIDTLMGEVYVYFNSYGEFVVLDSDKKQIAFFDNVDDGEEFELYNQIQAMSNPMNLLDLGFCAEIYYGEDLETFIKDLKKYDLFETSNPLSEIYRVGDFFVFFVY
jgi:hypothetical protein